MSKCAQFPYDVRVIKGYRKEDLVSFSDCTLLDLMIRSKKRGVALGDMDWMRIQGLRYSSGNLIDIEDSEISFGEYIDLRRMKYIAHKDFITISDIVATSSFEGMPGGFYIVRKRDRNYTLFLRPQYEGTKMLLNHLIYGE